MRKSKYSPELAKKTAEVLRETLSVEAAAAFAGVCTGIIRCTASKPWPSSPWGRDTNMLEAYAFFKKEAEAERKAQRQEPTKPLDANRFNISEWIDEVKLQCGTKISAAKKIKSISDEVAKLDERLEKASGKSKELIEQELCLLKLKLDALKNHFKMKYCNGRNFVRDFQDCGCRSRGMPRQKWKKLA